MTTLTWTCGFCRTVCASERAFTAHMCNESIAMGMGHNGNASAEPDMLRARVEELEGLLEFARVRAPGVVDRLEKDLDRKRDECERLEKVLATLRVENRRVELQQDDARDALASSALEIAKLRRELRGKR